MPLAAEDVRHACRVLRLRRGEAVSVSNGQGAVFRGVVTLAGPAEVRVLLKEAAFPAEPPIAITLLQSLVKGEGMDLIVRQAVELGARRLVPVITERSVPRWTAEQEKRRVARWCEIARSAAAQCRRGYLPVVDSVTSFQQALAISAAAPVALVPWEEEKESAMIDLFKQPPPVDRAVLIFIGPEGGFSRQEVGALTAAGAVSMHLGPRILRVETAAVATLALVQAAWGDLGGRRER